MIAHLKRLPAALLTAADWNIMFHRESGIAGKAQSIKFWEIQKMRAGDRHDADFMTARAEFKNDDKKSKMENRKR